MFRGEGGGRGKGKCVKNKYVSVVEVEAAGREGRIR